jgi:hypothetical protein
MARKQSTKAVAAAPVAPATPAATAPKNDSIRQTIRSGLLAGRTTAEITATVQEKFPGTQAAAKPARHIAYYRSTMRKAGELPKVGASAT